MGLFFGPALNFVLVDFDLKIGPLWIDGYTAPGFLMATAWTIFQFFMIFTYYTPAEIGLANENMEEQAEAEKLLMPDNIPSEDDSDIQLQQLDKGSTVSTSSINGGHLMFKRYYDELIDDGIVVCWAMFFLNFFQQTSYETVITPLMEMFFHFDTFKNSVAFAIIGTIGLVVSIVIGFLGKKKVDDRRLALMGLLLITLACLGCIVIFPVGDFGQKHLLVYFSTVVTIYMVGQTIFFISSLSLYSKIVKNHSMGFAMGVRQSIILFGMILGPLWTAGLMDNLYVMYGLHLFLCLFVMALFVLSYRRMIQY